MKTILILGFLLTSLNLSAAIEDASTAATTELSHEVAPEKILAFEVNNFHGDYEVRVLTSETSEVFSYDCHLHGTTMACHEAHDHDHKSLSILEIHQAEKTALARVKKVLARSNLTLEDIDTYKVWKDEDHHDHGHKSESDFWIKVSYDSKEIIQVCHIHAGETDYSCHYSAHAHDEPNF